MKRFSKFNEDAERKAFEKKILDIKQQVRQGVWDGNVDKDGNPVIMHDGKPYTVK